MSRTLFRLTKTKIEGLRGEKNFASLSLSVSVSLSLSLFLSAYLLQLSNCAGARTAGAQKTTEAGGRFISRHQPTKIKTNQNNAKEENKMSETLIKKPVAKKLPAQRPVQNGGASAGSHTGGASAGRSLHERYHRRTDDDLAVKIDQPVMLAINEWRQYVAAEIGSEITLDMAVEDLCREYLREKTDFQNWRVASSIERDNEANQPNRSAEKNHNEKSVVGTTNNGQFGRRDNNLQSNGIGSELAAANAAHS